MDKNLNIKVALVNIRDAFDALKRRIEISAAESYMEHELRQLDRMILQAKQLVAAEEQADA